MILSKVTGVNKVRGNMRRFGDDAARQFSIGLRKAGLHLQYISQKIYCPVFEGVLKNSAFTRRIGHGFGTTVIVGYTAPYAAYVHEDLDKKHGRAFNEAYAQKLATARTRRQKRYYRRRGPTQQAKFLEKPAREQRPEMLAIIAGQASSITRRRMVQGKIY